MARPAKVQIYLGAATSEDVQGCVNAGADFIGLVADEKLIGNREVGGHVLPTLQQVAEFFTLCNNRATTVALTFQHDASRILSMAKIVRPNVIHLAGDRTLSVHELASLRAALPNIKIMQAIAVNMPNPIELARQYQQVCDYFLLDSKGEEEEHPYGVGATGQTHDWQISKELIRAVNIPVILAGGLSAENVPKAIRDVNPWGVDSFTLTNIRPNRESRKDLKKVADFILQAKSL